MAFRWPRRRDAGLEFYLRKTRTKRFRNKLQESPRLLGSIFSLVPPHPLRHGACTVLYEPEVIAAFAGDGQGPSVLVVRTYDTQF